MFPKSVTITQRADCCRALRGCPRSRARAGLSWSPCAELGWDWCFPGHLRSHLSNPRAPVARQGRSSRSSVPAARDATCALRAGLRAAPGPAPLLLGSGSSSSCSCCCSCCCSCPALLLQDLSFSYSCCWGICRYRFKASLHRRKGVVPNLPTSESRREAP